MTDQQIVDAADPAVIADNRLDERVVRTLFRWGPLSEGRLVNKVAGLKMTSATWHACLTRLVEAKLVQVFSACYHNPTVRRIGLTELGAQCAKHMFRS